MSKRNGNLRVLKGRAIYGPMTRSDVLDLLADGRISGSDRVSVDHGDWTPLLDFLESSANDPPPEEPKGAWAQAAPAALVPSVESQPLLRVLQVDRIYKPMTRQQVLDLLAKKRLTGDELICAVNGPWMSLQDFLSESTTASPAKPDRPAPAPAAANFEALDDILDVLGLNAKPKMEVRDAWFVRVRGIHSAILQARHVKMMIDAKEINGDTPSRHADWSETNWKPLRNVPALARHLPA